MGAPVQRGSLAPWLGAFGPLGRSHFHGQGGLPPPWAPQPAGGQSSKVAALGAGLPAAPTGQRSWMLMQRRELTTHATDRI